MSINMILMLLIIVALVINSTSAAILYLRGKPVSGWEPLENISLLALLPFCYVSTLLENTGNNVDQYAHLFKASNFSKRTHNMAGLHKLWYPGIRDTSTWRKFGAHGEHGDVFLFSNLGALWFSENLIRYSLHVCLGEVKNNLFSSKHSYLRYFSWRF